MVALATTNQKMAIQIEPSMKRGSLVLTNKRAGGTVPINDLACKIYVGNRASAVFAQK
jgi:hypothetical protein